MEQETPTPQASEPEQPQQPDQLATAQAEAATAKETAAAAVKAMRDAVAAANPTIPASLITGDTPEAVLASVEAAKAIRDEILAVNQQPVPTGTQPPRGGSASAPALPENATPFEKIRFGIANRPA